MPKDNGYSFGTPREIDALKALEKRYMAKDKLNNGLFIEVKPTGSKVWLYRYTYNGKQERLTIGRYPDISLKDARAIRDETASLVAKGMSPKLEQEKSVVGRSACTTPWKLLNGFVSAWTNQITATALTVKAQWTCLIQLSTQVDFSLIKSTQDGIIGADLR